MGIDGQGALLHALPIGHGRKLIAPGPKKRLGVLNLLGNMGASA